MPGVHSFPFLLARGYFHVLSYALFGGTYSQVYFEGQNAQAVSICLSIFLGNNFAIFIH